MLHFVLHFIKVLQSHVIILLGIEIVKRYGLNSANKAERLERKMGVEGSREERTVRGNHYEAVYGDCVEETRAMESNSVDLIHTSIPFGNHYEYSANYNDFGHNQDTNRFFEQMDFLTPKLLRVLRPGRVAAVHVKDRVLFGNATGTGMPTIEPFHAVCIEHYMKHGFQSFGMITVVTDVVRENNQTYRLSWTEQCKDGSKMGVGCPEYILLFRKLPTDRSTAYVDDPVKKSKEDYTGAQWQIDAHGYWRSSGDRLISKKELESISVDNLQAVYRKYSRENVYSYKEHVALAKKLDEDGKLPATFMVVAPGSWNQMEVWDDINRMHKANHPNTKHYCEDVWQVDPVKACNGQPVGLAWFSPDCKPFSKAKGGKPKDKFIRGLAWVVCRWAGLVRPRVIMLENVEEFKTWRPLNRGHHPIKAKQGKTFEKFVSQLTE